LSYAPLPLVYCSLAGIPADATASPELNSELFAAFSTSASRACSRLPVLETAQFVREREQEGYTFEGKEYLSAA